MKYIAAKGNQTSGSVKTEVPFAPRPAAALQGSTPNPSVSYSNFRSSQPASVPTRTGRTEAGKSSARKPVPTQPLAAGAIEKAATTPISLDSQKLTSVGATTATVPRHQFRTRTTKRPLPVVMEINKMNIPKDFLARMGGEEDIYAKLPELWAKYGSPDDTYVNWTNPDAPSLWELTTIRHREAPIVPPPPGSPSSSASDSSVTSPSSTPNGKVDQKKNRSRVASVVSEVCGDSRYIGVSNKRAKLMAQSTKTQNKMGPLDSAQFRDYRLLPIDYFVSPLEGFEVEAEQEAAEAKDEDEDEGGRPRRSRRQPQPVQQQLLTPPPPREKKKKRRQITKTSVFVGKNHQVDNDDIPHVLGHAYKVDRSMYQDPHYVLNTLRDEQIWDPQKAEAAKLRGEDIDGFLSPTRELNSQMLLMQALHQADYCVKKAENKFVDLYRASKEPSAEMSDEEKAKADAMFETSRKDFGKIAKALNRSVASVLAQYYYWKSMEKKEGNGGYMRLKNLWKNEEDLCCICDDGGILILCDHCHKAFHLECLKPPLKKMPETDWYCNQCLKSPAKLRRMPSVTLGTLPELPKTTDGAKRALPFSSPQARPSIPSFVQQAQQPLPNLAQQPGNGSKSRAGEKVIDLTEE